MGNQLVGIAPSQIFPVERYLTDQPDLKFDKSLGSTRFFKVARAESPEGLIVVKVFVIHDPSLPLLRYKDQLDDIRKRLSNAVNCIPFQKVINNERAALIMREYVKFSLYDRICTRPYLTNIEKRWITFQILLALHQCHKVGVCHGDIKLENLMITSWNWVLLVDFASFKPTYLPEDNPADYSYFFDTSRRRTCYLAPERFTKATTTENSALITETSCDNGELTPAMDIFSTGCALLELWNERHVPFVYSQLLSYRAGKYYPDKHLDNLEDGNLRAMISSMIELDPCKRLSAETYLAKERGRLFPEYFYTVLQPYMLIFSSTPILLPDEKILRLKSDISNILTESNIIKFTDRNDEKCDIEKKSTTDSEGLVLIISIVTSCIRGLHDCSSKIYSLEILLELARYASDDMILDRILPYIMLLAKDSSPRVKICAINIITKCLNLVQKLPRSDSNIFPEYILPGLAPLAVDANVCVKAAYAKNIATLAEIALIYLDQIQNDWYDNSNNNNNNNSDNHTNKQIFNYEQELQALHGMIEQTVGHLLEDQQALVKQTLIENGITKLCVFFGKQKANDVILSHMITFLNEDDKQLRGSFYECIVGVAAYIGWHCSGILTPLLLQGLTDPCEFVTTKSINAMSALTELGLLTKPTLCEVVKECSSFLIHPNLWIRQAVVGFITITTKKLSMLDVQCKIMPNLKPYIKYPLIQIDRPELLLDSLVTPIPRKIYDMVVTQPNINLFLKTLKDLKTVRESVSVKIQSYHIPSEIKTFYERLQANEMTVQMEEYFLNMEHHLIKIHKHRAAAKNIKPNDGKIEITSSNTVKSHVFLLGDSQKGDFITDRLHRTNTSGSIDTNMNSDWNYSTEVLTRHSESTNSGGMSSRSTTSRPSSPLGDNHTFVSTEPSTNISLHERSYIQYRRSSCYLELNKLKMKQQEHYLEARRGKEWAEQEPWRTRLPPPEWHLRGTLVAHLHEHRGSINRLCSITDKPYFLSCAADGYVRLWDCNKMEGKNIANRSKQHYRLPSGCNITSMTVCDGGQSVAVAGQDGTLNILRLDPASSKMTSIQTRQLSEDDEGFVVDVHQLDNGFHNCIVYGTLYGGIIGWDLRAPTNLWRLDVELDKGYINTFCVDSRQSLLTLGTSRGHFKAFDLRFCLPINSFDQPGQDKINKVINHPTEHSWIIASVENSNTNNNNKILMWNLETKSLEKILWGSTSPPLTNSTQGPSNSTCALLAGCIDRSPFVLSGGTDQRLRFWNLSQPEKSYIAAPAANDTINNTNVTYQSRLIDGFHVICENAIGDKLRNSNSGSGSTTGDNFDDTPRCGPEQPPAGHRDCITDIALCKASQCFVVTSSRDGIIKVWK